jgi:hypothetical protein
VRLGSFKTLKDTLGWTGVKMSRILSLDFIRNKSSRDNGQAILEVLVDANYAEELDKIMGGPVLKFPVLRDFKRGQAANPAASEDDKQRIRQKTIERYQNSIRTTKREDVRFMFRHVLREELGEHFDENPDEIHVDSE